MARVTGAPVVGKRLQNRRVMGCVITASAAIIGGCASLGGGGGTPDYTLQILHVADMDGAAGALDNVAEFSALVEAFRAEHPDNTVFLSSGDNYIPGPRFFAAGADELAPVLGVPDNGRADMALLNAMGVAASAVGNHELDLGLSSFASIAGPGTAEDSDATYAGAAFPYLSSNIDFSTDEDSAPLVTAGAQPSADVAGQVAPSTIVDVNGEKLGVVGATTPVLASITSTGSATIMPEDSDDVAALAAIIQSSVDELTSAGINKIVLLAHMQQIAIEQALAPLLRDVDVIIAGGSNTLLADTNDKLRPGDSADDTYPMQFAGADGKPVMLVNVDGDYKYLGRLIIGFDKAGNVMPGSLDDTVNGAYAANADTVARFNATPNDDVVAIRDALNAVLAERDGNIVGRTAVYLDGRRGQVRTQETNMGNLTADANLWLAKRADPSVQVSLKNGGGIRAAIGLVIQPPGSNDPGAARFVLPPANPSVGKQEGDVSQFAVQGTLRFNNELTLLSLTASEFKDVLEHAVAASADGATPGQFPQVGGVRFSFDPAETAREGSDTNGNASVPGERIRNVALVDDAGAVTDIVVENGLVVGNPNRVIRIVTLNFIVKCVGAADEDCGDGYPYKGLAAPDRVDLTALATDPGQSGFADPGTEQDALAEFLTAFHASSPYSDAEAPAADDLRIQNLSARADTVLP